MAASDPDPTGQLLVFGVNHHSANAAVRERLFIEEVDHAAMLSEITAVGLEEAVLIATCDRLEVLASRADPEKAIAPLRDILAVRAGIPAGEIEAQCCRYLGEAALRHVFAVAASLDSQVVGEPQVLGQLKESHRQAVAAGTVGPVLDSVLQGAFSMAKRVRSETAVGEGPVSIAAAALLVARNLHGDLSRCRVILFGLGEMAELMALELRRVGLADLTVLHPSLGRAEAAAHRLQGHFKPVEHLAEALVHADIAVTSQGSGRHGVTVPMVEAALKQRRHKPILFVDTAVPCDVEPAVGALDSAFLYSLSDLEEVAKEGKETRESAAAAAWRVLDEELSRFLMRRKERAAVPAVTALHRHFETAREQILNRGDLDAETATRLLIKRLLHDPSEVLRGAVIGDRAAGHDLERTIRRLFRLDHEQSESQGEPDSEDEP